ncbi:30S ribosomal protein S6 [candidate division WS5 bacterium]|uniref:Small ribosomal subunit protein bS6 n=1 Tax=candidate division WS5 bacterium TaxID=2093353 RepID=A0A419DEV3_9BACT|nr:MAG: 30S ribosomal protein S6 [candidate division WS5 bacterium]
MKKYEIVYIIHPDLEGSTAKITEKAKSMVEKSGGQVLNEENWGKKKLAYEIKKNTFGIYVFMLVEMEADSMREIERTLRLSEEIIRSMIVLAEEEIPAKVSEKKTKAVKKEEKELKVEKPQKAKQEKKPAKTKAEKEIEEKERQKVLDEKLQAIIGPEEES